MIQPASSTNAERVRRLADTLSACSIGKLVTFSQLTKAIKVEILAHRYLLPQAFRLINEETGAVFRSVRGVGYERLPQNEAHGRGRAARTKARRLFKREVKTINNAVRYANDLSQDDMKRAYTELTHLGLLQHLTYDRAAPKVPEGALPLDPGHAAKETLEAMRTALGRNA